MKSINEFINESLKDYIKKHDYYFDDIDIVEDDKTIGEIYDDGTIEFNEKYKQP